MNALTELLIERGLSEAHAVTLTCCLLFALDIFERDVETGTYALRTVSFGLARYLTPEELQHHLTASVATREAMMGRGPAPAQPARVKVFARTADDPDYVFEI